MLTRQEWYRQSKLVLDPMKQLVEEQLIPTPRFPVREIVPDVRSPGCATPFDWRVHEAKHLRACALRRRLAGRHRLGAPVVNHHWCAHGHSPQAAGIAFA